MCPREGAINPGRKRAGYSHALSPMTAGSLGNGQETESGGNAAAR
jgi:hypothetical protein